MVRTIQAIYHYRHLESPGRDYATVLLVGGAFQSMDSMRRFAEFFLQRTSVILVDLPGSGESDLLPPEYGAAFLADCLQAVLDRENVDRVTVIGVSFGTAIAYKMAQRYPESVSNLVLIGTMSHMNRRISAGLQLCLDALAQDDVGEFSNRVSRVLLNHDRSSDIANFGLANKLIRSATSRISQSGIDQFVTNGRRLLTHRRLDTETPPTARALVFTGEHDHLTTPECSREVAASMRDAWFTTVDNADHLVPLQRFDVCTELVDTFLLGRSLDGVPGCCAIERLSAA